MRLLMIAAAGASGNKMAMRLFKLLDKEARGATTAKPEKNDGSEIPLNQSDFNKMMQSED
jgi:3-polyprenyl-4-hydroxybenzoate decarboxylase